MTLSPLLNGAPNTTFQNTATSCPGSIASISPSFIANNSNPTYSTTAWAKHNYQENTLNFSLERNSLVNMLSITDNLINKKINGYDIYQFLSWTIEDGDFVFYFKAKCHEIEDTTIHIYFSTDLINKLNLIGLKYSPIKRNSFKAEECDIGEAYLENL